MYEAVKDLLDDAIWSFVEKGVRLPDYPEDRLEDQRWFNPRWYDATLFSVVNEDSESEQPLIMTEKTFKPIAFFHPFVVVAQPGLLSLIRQSGFLTWPELFDESYDMIPDLQTRVYKIDAEIRQVDRDRLCSPDIQEKLKYNHDRFFDQDLVFSKMKDRLIHPILHFVETCR